MPKQSPAPVQEPTPIQFYYFSGTRASRVHWALEELKLSYKITVVDLKRGDHQQDSYKAIHPLAKVPAVVIDGQALFESLGIVLYLADRYPAAGLAPEVDSPLRGEYCQWMSFAVGTLEPAVINAIRADGVSSKEAEAFDLGPAFTPLERIADYLEGRFSTSRWLLGEQFTMADLMVASLLFWAHNKALLDDFPGLLRWLEKVQQRPAYQAIQV